MVLLGIWVDCAVARVDIFLRRCAAYPVVLRFMLVRVCGCGWLMFGLWLVVV